MKIRLIVGEKEKTVNINFWDLLKIYVAISITATLIFLVAWVIILLIGFWL